jgi:hypothetical protein
MSKAKTSTSAVPLLVFAIASSLIGVISQPANGQYQSPSSLQGKTIVIPIGTTFEGRLDTTIGSAVSHQGERFVISTTSPILANGTEVLIPTGSEVIGEVVEAIPSHSVPHSKTEGKQIGKLSVQLTALKMPDGLTFPLVASIVPDKTRYGSGGGQSRPLGTGVAYVGSESSFTAVAPGNPAYIRQQRGQAPRVVSPGEIMRDPILGTDQTYANMGSQQGAAIRSLVRRKNDLFIYSGSPLSMRIDAPFKISVGAAQSTAATLEPVPLSPDTIGRGGRRFSKDGAGGQVNSQPPGNAPSVSPPPAQQQSQGTQQAVQPTRANPTGGQPVAPTGPPVRKHDPNDSEF